MKLNNNDDSHNSGLNLLIYNMLLDIESHPTWVCGLKQFRQFVIDPAGAVTPYVGVWIETFPRWLLQILPYVTPYVGVWIETACNMIRKTRCSVTPFVGVWIETSKSNCSKKRKPSHTLRGCVD